MKLNLERLEDRLALSTVLDNNGILTVLGTEGNDYLQVYQPPGDPTTIVVNDNGAVHGFPAAAVREVRVLGLGGNDRLIAQNVAAALTLDGGEGADILNRSGGGTATLLGQGGNDLIHSAFGGQTFIDAGAGNDMIAVYFGSAVVVTGPGADTVVSVFSAVAVEDASSEDMVFRFGGRVS